MEETNDIGEIITQALDSEVIDKFRYSDGSLAEIYAETIILYCIIMRNTKPPKDLCLSGLTGEYICQMVAQKLEITKIDTDEKKEKIFDYIYNNLIENGFCFHITNDKLADNIRAEGLKKSADTNASLDISKIFNLLKKYGNLSINLFTFSSVDIKDSSGLYFNCYPGEIGRYFYSPEWFKLFCRGIESHVFEDGEYSAFERKDYERIVEGIQLFISKYNISEQDANDLVGFLNKYWKMFENSKPTLVLIPRKTLGIDGIEFKDYFEDMYSDDLEDLGLEDITNETELYYKVDKLLEYYREFYMVLKSSQKSTHNIDSMALSFADLSQLMPEKDRTKLQEPNGSNIFSWDRIVRKALEMGVTRKDCLDIQKAENLTPTIEGEIEVND